MHECIGKAFRQPSPLPTYTHPHSKGLEAAGALKQAAAYAAPSYVFGLVPGMGHACLGLLPGRGVGVGRSSGTLRAFA